MITESHSNNKIDMYFRAAIKLVGQRLFLTVDEPPKVEIDGVRRPMNRPPIDVAEMESLVLPILSESEIAQLNRDGNLKFIRWVEIDGNKHMFNVEVSIESRNISLVAVPGFDPDIA